MCLHSFPLTERISCRSQGFGSLLQAPFDKSCPSHHDTHTGMSCIVKSTLCITFSSRSPGHNTVCKDLSTSLLITSLDQHFTVCLRECVPFSSLSEHWECERISVCCQNVSSTGLVKHIQKSIMSECASVL